jgi:hypothetical protein
MDPGHESRGVAGEWKIQWKPMACMHCGSPACVRFAPPGHIKREEDGIVLVNKDLCIGALNASGHVLSALLKWVTTERCRNALSASTGHQRWNTRVRPKLSSEAMYWNSQELSKLTEEI